MSSHEWTRVRGLLERALELEGEERERFLARASGDDQALRAELDALLAHDARTGALEPPPAERLAHAFGGDASDAERVVGAWRLERRLGLGGMGVVWLAQRVGGGFEQRVAIKLIKRGMDTDELLRRFERERAVLAGLAHPNIARLYDGGTTDDGRPYLAMEYVDGLPLDRYCDERALGLRQRIELFLAVCAAVEHAHRHLVVHRDLKPSNVLVGADGTPKLLDFGIAKVLAPDGAEREEERTLTAQRVLTPLYASPEQMRGEKLTTQSDVYSLGVMLYELLSGARPFDGERKPDTEPAPPSRAATRKHPSTPHGRSLVGDLDTIVLKALQVEPARRYASVEHLRDDLRRHLDGLPVLARPDTLRYRAAKFVRRNRLLVAALAAVFATLVAGLVASTTLYLDMRAARDDERAQRELAAERLRGVLAIASSFTRDLGARLAHLGGATEAREQFLREALAQLEKLAQQAPDDASVQLELGWACHDLAATLGSPNGNNRGRYGEALQLYDRPVAVAEKLLARDAQDAQYVDLAATALTSRAVLLRFLQRGDEARRDLERAVELARGALSRADNGTESGPLRRLSEALKQLATLERDQHDFADAEQYEREMLELLERGCAAHPQDAALRYSYANALYERGLGAQGRGDSVPATTWLEQALAIYDALRTEDRHSAVYGRACALAAGALVDPLIVADDIERAAAMAQRALDGWEAVVRVEPDDEAALGALVDFAHRVGYIEQYRHRLDVARAAFERTLEVQAVLMARHPEERWRKSGRAMVSAELASTLAELGRWQEAFERGQRALDEVESLATPEERGREWNYSRSMVRTMLAECRIYAARDSDWTPDARRAQLELARELLDASRAILVEARDVGELTPSQTTEIELIDERYRKVAEVRAAIPES